MVGGASLWLAVILAAQSASTAQPSPIGALEACRSVTDNARRLACFDQAAAALVEARRSGAISIVDRGQLRQARRSLFGFSLPSLPFLVGDRSPEDDSGTLESTVRSVRSLGYGKVQVVIADGNAVWETTESYSTFDVPRAGSKVVIKRGPLGSYMLRFDGQRAVKGRRLG